MDKIFAHATHVTECKKLKTMLSIYAYIDGSDLQEVEDLLLKELTVFLKNWDIESARVVNKRFLRTADLAPEDFPDWNLGLNFEMESMSRDKVEALVEGLARIAVVTDREFVIGTSYENGVNEDWCFVGPEVKPDTIEFLVEQFQ